MTGRHASLLCFAGTPTTQSSAIAVMSLFLRAVFFPSDHDQQLEVTVVIPTESTRTPLKAGKNSPGPHYLICCPYQPTNGLLAGKQHPARNV